MLGAIIGDICGSRFEWSNIKSKQFQFFKRQCREQKGFLARTGENQFSIIMESNELSEIESFCQKLIRECERDGMQANMNTWKVSFSIHYADISNISSSNISKIFNEAQKNCYKPETPAPKE